jgi:hypothetical protein
MTTRSGPLFTALCARIFLREWLSPQQWRGLVMALSASWWPTGVPDPTVGAATLLGDALLIGGLVRVNRPPEQVVARSKQADRATPSSGSHSPAAVAATDS